jgi:hypothetical protein
MKWTELHQEGVGCYLKVAVKTRREVTRDLVGEHQDMVPAHCNDIFGSKKVIDGLSQA